MFLLVIGVKENLMIKIEDYGVDLQYKLKIKRFTSQVIQGFVNNSLNK